jgi:hypothetical protein
MGGGIYIDSTPVYCSMNHFYHVPQIKNCVIENNSTTNLGGGGCGGGIYDVGSDTEIENCEFQGNTSNAGGAIHHNYSSITIDKCVFHGNQAIASGFCGGGAIYGFYFNQTTGGLTFITNYLFYQNSSVSRGGAICNNQVDPQIWNCTFFGNTAGAIYSGGAYYGFHLSDKPYIQNCIFWNNSPDQLQIDDPHHYVGHSDVQGGWSGVGADNIDDDPVFINSGAGDFHLSLGSPCIDSGRYFGTALPDDLDGVLRPHDGNGDGTAAWDMGAYEFRLITMPGDFDWDWDIDGGDLPGFANSFGSHLGDAAYNASFDFDENRAIDEQDLEVLAEWFGQRDNP